MTALVSCSGSSESTRIEPTKLEVDDPNVCEYPNSKTRAPDWVCGTPVDGYPIAAVGTHRSTKAGVSHARKMATQNGRTALAAEMKTLIGEISKNFMQTTGVGDQETVDAFTSVAQRQVTAETLFGSKAIQFKQGPDGTTYALVVMDASQAANAAKQVLQTSYNNQRAQYQQFLGQKADAEVQSEMNKSIGAVTGATPQ